MWRAHHLAPSSAIAARRAAGPLLLRSALRHTDQVEKRQDLMKPGQRRALTSGEVAFGRAVFADEIPWPKVRILQAPALGFGAMVPFGRTIVFSKWRASRDFAAAPNWDQGWFVHELAHVWQAARGVVLAGAKLGALGKAAYAYEPCQPKLSAYNIERQAEIARHLFLARIGAPEHGAPTKDWLEATWASR